MFFVDLEFWVRYQKNDVGKHCITLQKYIITSVKIHLRFSEKCICEKCQLIEFGDFFRSKTQEKTPDVSQENPKLFCPPLQFKFKFSQLDERGKAPQQSARAQRARFLHGHAGAKHPTSDSPTKARNLRFEPSHDPVRK